MNALLGQLSSLLGPVHPALAALWWLSAVALALLIVYGWHRLSRRS